MIQGEITKDILINALCGRSQAEAAIYLNTHYTTITRLRKKYGVEYDKEASKIAMLNGAKAGSKILHANYSFKGENNPNWKGGITKNHYHYKKIQVQRYPERVKARSKVYCAVKSGKLTKGVCVICGNTETFAHHTDYNNPLDVIWLCRPHHREQHNNKH